MWKSRVAAQIDTIELRPVYMRTQHSWYDDLTAAIACVFTMLALGHAHDRSAWAQESSSRERSAAIRTGAGSPAVPAQPMYRCEIAEPVSLVSRLHVLLASIQCPSLPAGRSCSIHVTLVNPLDEMIEVGKCDAYGNFKATLKPNRIPPLGTASLEVEITTPDFGRSSRFDTTMTFDAITDQGPAQIGISLHYELNGLLNFKNSFQSIALDSVGEAISFEVPLISTVESPDFEIDFDGNAVFEDMQISQDHSKLIVTVAPDLVPVKGVFGRLKLRDANSGRSTVIDLLVQRPGKLIMSPASIRFTHSDEGRQKAFAFLRFAEPRSDNKPAVFVEAFVGGKSVNVETTKLSNRVIRLDVSSTTEALMFAKADSERESDAFEVSWRILAAGEQFAFNSPIRDNK